MKKDVILCALYLAILIAIIQAIVTYYEQKRIEEFVGEPAVISEPVKIFEMESCGDMTFFRDGKEIGRLTFRDGRWTFEGDVDDSARIFYDAIERIWKGLEE
jgi:acetoacetate decarboxylase